MILRWLKNKLCGAELAALKSEINRLRKDRERAFYERDKALNRADRIERELSVCRYELRERTAGR